MNKYSFYDILTKEIEFNEKENRKGFINNIEIPMIQRDYAQGREKQEDVRERFLNAIFSTLQEKRILNLDFIYGSIYYSNINTTNASSRFIPLDGQQRLTTLFLLYWYIGNKELDDVQLQELMKNLGKFTYATRDSSRRFCEKLVSENKNLNFNKDPRTEIMNQSWFFRAYSKDPTIKSMLVMLEAIAKYYKKIEDIQKPLYEKLNNLRFYLLFLEEFKLSDELYVKMNARGKLLTGFENFKADLINWMKTDDNPCHNFLYKQTKLNNRTLLYYQNLSLKIDTKWTDFFWKTCSSEDQKKNI